MPTGTIILLGAFAGLTIYLGLPFALLKHGPRLLTSFLSMLATGILIFLLYDVISKASEPIADALDQARLHHTATGTLFLDLFLLIFGLGLGYVGLVYFNTYFIGRFQVGKTAHAKRVSAPAPLSKGALAGAGTQELSPGEIPSNAVRTVAPARAAVAHSPGGELTPQMLALIIAAGIGLHNFSEGLAIGQSAAVGALQLAVVLIIGFGLHNMTEGFGIAGPLVGQSVSGKFILLAGLIGGGPTCLGTVVGIIFHSPQVFILFLALAAGAIIYVVAELLGVAKRFKAPDIVMWGLLTGFLLGYATDLVLTFAGA